MPQQSSPSFPHEGATTTATNATKSAQGNDTVKEPQHKRVYQACIPCRRRKVKCNLGSVDSPQDPPCQRCRRESKDCFFSATRRKRKTDEDEVLDGKDDYVKRNGRKRLHSEASPPPQALTPGANSSRPSSFLDNPTGPPPLTPGGSIGRAQPLRRPQHSANGSQNAKEDPNGQWENFEAQRVMIREVYGPHDALDLLYKAATNRLSPGHKRARSDAHHEATVKDGTAPSPRGNTPGINVTTGEIMYASTLKPPDPRNTAIDPALASDHRRYSEASRSVEYNEALKAWARFRFVRAGWFTASEAISYIEYYYKYLSPLTPISPPTFREPSTHFTLLTEEPILTVTLLTIASRYMKIEGPGSHCRGHAIHEQLWTYLRGMIERCLWGQEAFGGGFCGSGGSDIHDASGSSTAPWRGLRKGSLRTLGTVESLMILTEWHPRALHFPPAEATDELMLPEYNVPDTFSSDEGESHRVPGGVGGKRIESWLEPAWRSDRMCWMLLSNAMGLSYELGVFDKIEEMLAAGGEMARPEYEDEGYRLRASRIKKLLLIYVTQLAGRLGWTNMVPEDLRQSEPAFEQRRTKASNDFNSPGTNTTASNNFNYIPDLELDDQIIHCWSSITTVMRIGNERLFRSRRHTTSIIQNGKYIDILKDFQPMLATWLKDFERFSLPPYIRHILAIEFEYVRIYLNSLSLQAVVERCTNSAAPQGRGIQGTMAGMNMADLSPETQSYYGKIPLAKLGGYGEADSEYIKQVVDGSRNLLRTVVEGLLPNDYLKHAPVRTYFRIISGAMFLLKTFALGAPKAEIETSIALMDRAVDALRNCVVDDVHLGIRFAELLETLTTRLRNRFIHSIAQLQPPTASGTQSPIATNNHSDQQQQAGGAEARHNWNANMSAANFDQLTSQSELHASIRAISFDPNQGPHQSFPTLPALYSIPNIYPGNNVGADMGNGYGVEREEAEDFWYLPTGAAFFQNNDQPITQTAEGVNVGGWDLLDLMTMDQVPFGSDSTF